MSGEMGGFLATQSIQQPRRFRSFPKVWGRRVKWFDIPTMRWISRRRAEQIFRSGKPVGYVAQRFTFAIIYDPNGQEPSR